MAGVVTFSCWASRVTPYFWTKRPNGVAHSTECLMIGHKMQKPRRLATQAFSESRLSGVLCVQVSRWRPDKLSRPTLLLFGHLLQYPIHHLNFQCFKHRTDEKYFLQIGDHFINRLFTAGIWQLLACHCCALLVHACCLAAEHSDDHAPAKEFLGFRAKVYLHLH